MSMFLAGACMGTAGMFISFLSHYPVHTIVLVRGLFGAFFLSAFMIKNETLSREFLSESFKLHWKLLVLLAIIDPLGVFLYVLATMLTGYAISTFLLLNV